MTIDKNTGYIGAHTMRDLIRDNVRLLPTLSRFDIPFGFGDSSIQQVCADNGVDTGTFLAVCNLLSGYPYRVDDISLPSLTEYLKHAHRSIIEITLPKIRHHLIEAINYSYSSEAALLLIKFYDDYTEEVRTHMAHENDVIFKYVDQLLAGELTPSFSIARYSVNHGSMATTLQQLKDIFIYHYKQKGTERLSATLFEIIECENDMISHFDVEDKLLVPAVLKLENQLQSDSQPEADNQEVDAEEHTDNQLDTLSEREIDIIRCVAQGMGNKEIADRLCISVHTVATHRRNISTKLDIHSSAGLTVFAIIHGIITLQV